MRSKRKRMRCGNGVMEVRMIYAVRQLSFATRNGKIVFVIPVTFPRLREWRIDQQDGRLCDFVRGLSVNPMTFGGRPMFG